MAPVDLDAQAVRRHLERVLSSANFTRSERLSRILRYVVERHLEGRDDDLKESLIALEVLGNRDYDPKRDSIVRTEAARLRTRLAEYYAGEGAGERVIIEIPKGGYVPVFRRDEPPGERKVAPWRRWVAIGLAALAFTLAATAWWWIQQRSRPVAIAVLPLNNLCANDYFADGLTGEIIRNLSVIDGLAVRSQTSSFAFKGKPRNVREVGKQLAVDYVLEGSILCSGQQLRINAQLVRVRDDLPLWTGRYDRELTDIFAIQDEISRGIVNSLRLKLGRGRRRYETNIEAYDLYLRARSLEIQRGFPGLTKSVDAFEKAIAKDPGFAPAYAGLAAAHAVRSGQFRFDLTEEVTEMRRAAERAIELDPLLAEAHDALGTAYARDAQWDKSEQSFRRAIQLDPGSSDARRHFARYLLWPLGRIEEAVRYVRDATKADPLSLEARFQLAHLLIAAGRYAEAVTHCEELPEGYWSKELCLGRARLGQERIAAVIQMLEPSFHRGISEGSESRGVLGSAYARAGRRDEAEKIAAASPINPFNVAAIFAGLGDKDRAFEALDRAAAAGPIRIGWALTLPELAPLRGDPRVKALRKKVGLPE